MIAVSHTLGSIVPAGCWLEPTGAADAEGRPGMRQATRGGLAGLVNGGVDLPAASGGVPVAGQAHFPLAGVVALAVHPSDTLAAGDTLGPVAGDWYCRKGYPGFRVLGPAFGGFVPAVADPTAAGFLAAVRYYALPTEIAGRADWTLATLYVHRARDGALVAVSPAETVEVQTCWGIMRANVGPCPATDTGARSPDTGRRRFRLDTVVLAADVATTACLSDGSQGTVTRRIPGAAGPEG